MTEIRLLGVGSGSHTLPAPVFLARLNEDIRSQTALPFSDERVDIVRSVGSKLLKMTGYSPFVTHFAFWTRAAAVQQLKESFLARLPAHTLARPRGLVFHLPPQNVETVFLYSWVLSYLVGNANIVRLPSAVSSEMQSVCSLFMAQLQERGDTSQLFVHYDAASDVSADISALSDARIVWGGDAKVAALAGFPLRKGGKALWFGDRFSWAIFSGEALNGLAPKQRRALAQKFANDIGVFDQMACASPHILYVVGEVAEHLTAVEAFLTDLSDSIGLRQPQPAAGHNIHKMTEAFALASSAEGTRVYWRNPLLTAVLTGKADRKMRVGGGFLQVAFLTSTDEIGKIPREHDQTVVHFGFSTGEISEVADRHAGPGISRWCPVGTALDFDSIWDGYDIPFELTRLVRMSWA